MSRSAPPPQDAPEGLFCPYPFTTLEVDVEGYVRPCCLFERPYQRDDGAPFDVRRQSLAEIWRSDDVDRVRRALRAGEALADCARCWDIEAVGGQSRRLVELRRTKEAPADLGAPKLRTLQLNPGNRCNLKCRTCSPHSSTAWRGEWREVSARARRLGSTSGPFDLPGDFVVDWAADPGRVWQDIEPLVATLELLEVHGGEPMHIPEHLELLERCVASGHASHIALSYNTNGTRIPDRAEGLWRAFRSLHVQVSTDGVGPRFEYLRYPARWDDVRANIDRYRALGFVELSVNATVSALNALYLDEFLGWAGGEGLRVELHPVGSPPWYDPRVLPPGARREAHERLDGVAFPDPAVVARAQRLLDLMDSDDGSDAMLRELALRTRLHDEARGQSVDESLPRLARWLPAVDTREPAAP